MDIYDITASALTAQRLRLDVIASNLANVNSTRKPDGTLGAYKRKNVVFAPLLDERTNAMMEQLPFKPMSGSKSGPAGLALNPSPTGMSIGSGGKALLKAGVSHTEFDGMGVKVMRIKDDEETPMRLVYDPSHPDANGQGYVEMPNINVVSEIVDMISASRAYEANVTAFESAKSMSKAAMDI